MSSGVLVRQVEAVVFGRPEGRRPLVVEFSVNAARARLRFLPTLGVEHGAASTAPAKSRQRFVSITRVKTWLQQQAGARRKE